MLEWLSASMSESVPRASCTLQPGSATCSEYRRHDDVKLSSRNVHKKALSRVQSDSLSRSQYNIYHSPTSRPPPHFLEVPRRLSCTGNPSKRTPASFAQHPTSHQHTPTKPCLTVQDEAHKHKDSRHFGVSSSKKAPACRTKLTQNYFRLPGLER